MRFGHFYENVSRQKSFGQTEFEQKKRGPFHSVELGVVNKHWIRMFKTLYEQSHLQKTKTKNKECDFQKILSFDFN
jgi:hypothetical protein